MSSGDTTAALYRDIFEDDRRGAAILEDLVARFGGARITTSGGIDAVLQTYRTGGQREVIDFIIRRINDANGVPPDAEAAEG